MAKSFDELARRTMSLSARRKALQKSRELMAEMFLGEVRKLTGRSQRELARVLGIKQPSLSKLEHQEDMQVSTLARIVESLGGRLEIVAEFPSAAVRIKQFDGRRANGGKLGKSNSRLSSKLTDVKAARKSLRSRGKNISLKEIKSELGL